MLVFIDCVHCHSVMFVHLNKLECVNMPPALHFSFFSIYQYHYIYSVYYEIKCSLFENFTEVVLHLK